MKFNKLAVYFVVALLLALGSLIPTANVAHAAPPAGDLDQCRNGGATSPQDCGPGWANGNVNSTQGHMIEGYSIAYRQVLTDLPTDGTVITMILEYDLTDSSLGGDGVSQKAIDFLTHYDRLEPHDGFEHPAETINPLEGISGVDVMIDTHPIPEPSDPFGPAATDAMLEDSWDSVPAGEKVMTLFGGDISDVSYVSEGDFDDAGAKPQISVTFIVNSSTAVLAWGGTSLEPRNGVMIIRRLVLMVRPIICARSAGI